MAAKTFKKPAEDAKRTADLKVIHIAKKQLGMDDDTYRAMIREVTGGRKSSSADLSARDRRAVIDHMERCGFKIKRRKDKRPRNMDRHGSRAEQLRKIEALLTVGGKSWSYADTIAKTMRLADKVEWVADDELYKIITALRKQAQREHWDLSGE